jgi:hypothetical protein
LEFLSLPWFTLVSVKHLLHDFGIASTAFARSFGDYLVKGSVPLCLDKITLFKHKTVFFCRFYVILDPFT